MLPPTAGIADEQDRSEMAFQQRRDVREITRDIIREARFASRESLSPGGKSRAGPNNIKATPRFGHTCHIDIRQS